MAKFVYNGKTRESFTGHQKIAMKNIKNAFDYIIGGYYNCIQDGCEEYLPKSRKSVADEIYSSAMENLYYPGCEFSGRSPKEMRFAGADFCKAYIDWKLDHDGDAIKIAEVANW